VNLLWPIRNIGRVCNILPLLDDVVDAPCPDDGDSVYGAGQMRLNLRTTNAALAFAANQHFKLRIGEKQIAGVVLALHADGGKPSLIR
jgi:hypothetical protein